MSRVLDLARRRKPEVLASLVVAFVALLALYPVPHSAFVMWDDDIELYRNPHIGPLSLERLRWIFTDYAQTQRYTPLAWLNWCSLDHLFGLHPFVYHLENVLLHAANAVLVFWFLRSLLVLAGAADERHRPTLAAALGALLWALHPLRVETVAWVTQERFTQSTFFCLIALVAYLRAVGGEEGRVARGPLVVAVAASAASVLSYGISAPLPVVLAVLDVYPLGRLPHDPGNWWTPRARRIWGEKVLFALAPALVGFVTLWARLHPVGFWTAALPLGAFGLFPRIMQAFYVWAYYVWRPFVPFHLSPVYTRLVTFDPLEPAFVLSAALVLVLTFAAYRLRRQWPALLATWICYVALMAPMVGFTEHPHYTSDRYSYLGGICGSVLVAAGVASLWSRTTKRAFTASLVPLVAVAAGLGALSARQALVWRDSETLFRHILAELRDDPYRRADIHFRLGLFYLDVGRKDDAFESFRATLALMPAHARALANTGALYLDRGMPAEAARAFTSALGGIESPIFRNGLGLALEGLGRLADARHEFETAVEEAPDYADARYNLGRVLLTLGDRPSARREHDALLPLDSALARSLMDKIDDAR